MPEFLLFPVRPWLLGLRRPQGAQQMVVGYEVERGLGDSTPPSFKKPSHDWNPRISVFTLWSASHFFLSLEKKLNGLLRKSGLSPPPPK